MKKKIVLAGIFTYLFILKTLSQNEIIFLKKDKELTVAFGPMATTIDANANHDSYKIAQNKNGVNAEFQFNKYFADRVGFGVGLGYSSYSQSMKQNGLFEKAGLTDKDGNSYELWMNSKVDYTYKLSYFDIPVTFHLLLGHSRRFYGFIDAGIINQFLISGTSREKGLIESIGRYPTDNPYFFVISQNNSYYGYGTSLFDKKNDDNYKFYHLSAHVSVGMAAAITDNLFLKFQPYVNIGLSDINGKNLKGVIYRNIFGETSSYQKTKLFAIGLNVGFAFNLEN